MSMERQGTVKSELSPDGGLKLTIKREKTVDDACKPEWVTEARGGGLGKLVIKRKSPGSASRSPKAASLRVDKQTEQRPVLRLSLTTTASTDGNRCAQVKCWSLCEVSSAVEDVASASELSPACHLQPSPKDSGIDMSSPPHDDGAVGVEQNAGTGVWSITDSHSGDNSAVEVEKGSLDRLETTVASFAQASNAVHSNSKELWPDTGLHSCETNQSKVQSTLRSRRERSALKSLTSSSQKLINPLAKSRAVGRYQHMLPVNRIRAESNVARRSSLEESPTYNVVASRTTLRSWLPQVKTKLKLLSNNTYAPVFDHDIESKAVARKSNEKSSAVDDCKRNRLACTSEPDACENMKVKLCFTDRNRRSGVGDDKIRKLPKLKLVVKSEPALTVSCTEQQLETASVKQSEENTAGHVRQKRRQREVGKVKASWNNASARTCCATAGVNANNLPSLGTAAVRKCRRKHRSLEAKCDDCEFQEKKSKLQDCTEQLARQSRELTDSQLSYEEDRADSAGDTTVHSVDNTASVDEATCGVAMSLSSTQTDELSTDQSSACDVSSNTHTAVQEEAEKSVAQTESSALSAESDSDVMHAMNGSSLVINNQEQCSEVSDFDSEKCTALTCSNVNADDDTSRVDWQSEERFSPCNDSVAVVREDKLSAVCEQHDYNCDHSSSRDDEALVTSESHVADNKPHTPGDQSTNSHHTCAAFDDSSTPVITEQSATMSTSVVVTSVLSSPLVSDGNISVVQNTVLASILPLDSNGSDITGVQDNSLSLNLKPGVTEDGCITVHNQNTACAVDSGKSDCQDTNCQHDDVQRCLLGRKELCKTNFELKSGCYPSDQDLKPGKECEQADSDTAYLFDIPSHPIPLSSPCNSKEHKETAVANSACSNGFLAAFTQFVKKVSAKKKTASSKFVVTDNTSESTDEMPLKHGRSRKRRPFTSKRELHTCSEKPDLSEVKRPRHVAHSDVIDTIECVSIKEASLQETGSLQDIECSKRLTCTAVDEEYSTVCREEVMNIVSSYHQLVRLRYRVCELIETLLPELQFPPGFQRDSAFVERYVKDITDELSNREAHEPDVQQCSDPVVSLHRMPDRGLQSLQQQVIELLSLLLPDTDLSGITDDNSLDVFLELVTSFNRPLLDTSHSSEPNLHLSLETNPQPSDKLQLSDQPPSLPHANTDIECEQIDGSVCRTESHMSPIDSLFSTPSSLLQINSPGPIRDKRSIRRQVKDCLMFLDRDLT